MTTPGRFKRAALNAAGDVALGVLSRAHLKSLIASPQCQERVFQSLKRHLSGAVMGRDMRLDRFDSHRSFIRNVPPRSYDFYEDYVKRVMEGEPGVLYPDRTEYLLMTSGTSGFNSKIIPYNTAQRMMLERCQRRALAVLVGQSRGLALASDRFAYGTRAGGERVNGIPKDYISGIIPHLIPRALRAYVVPPEDALCMRDWNAKVERIAAATLHRDVRGIFGVPAHLLHVLRDVLAAWGAGCLREVWPNLEVCCYSGTSVQSLRHSLDELAGVKLFYFGAYVATESPLGFEMPGYASGPARMAFFPDQVLYSFQDLNHPDKPPLALDELREGGDYLVNISTPNGILHYALKDWIKVARTEPFVQFEVMGRIDAMLNAATEKTSEAQLARTVRRWQEQSGLHVAHYFVHPSGDERGTPRYEWTFAMDVKPDPIDLAREIDALLMDAAPDYREARLDTAALAPPVVNIVSPAGVREHLGRRMNGPGQYKMRHAFRSAQELRAYYDVAAGSVAPPEESPLLEAVACR